MANHGRQETKTHAGVNVKRDIGIALWVSFLGASLGSLVIFGLLDPQAMTGAWTEKWDMGREWGYTLGFAFLWVVCIVTAALTLYLVRTGPDSVHAGVQVAGIKLPEQGVPGLKGGKVVGHEDS
ncbi:MAG: hypothetical protein L3J24_12200 [Xanthomonadales bacterium]|nr:hypothetical protein [Xanthomonadales bacterium]